MLKLKALPGGWLLHTSVSARPHHRD